MYIPLVPRWSRWLLVGIATAGILYFSVITTPSAPSGAGPFWDKKLHFLAYGGLTLAYAYATAQYRHRPVRRAVGVLGIVILFGVFVEVLQGIVPVRQFSIGDLLANSIGALLASVWFFIEARIPYRKVEPSVLPE